MNVTLSSGILTVLFVNGIPLIMIEAKAAHKSLVDAYRDNIRDYKDTIPKLFWYNMGIIISNGIENKFGSLTSPFPVWPARSGRARRPRSR